MNKALRTLLIYNGIFVLAYGLLGPLYAVYVQKLGGQIFIISLSWSVFLVASTLTTFIISRFGDRVQEQEYFLLAGFLLRAIVWIMYIFVPNIQFLIILQIILGIGDALGSPAFDSLVAEHLDKGRHIAEYSDMKILFNLSNALATIVGGVIASQLGFAYLFILMSILSMVSFFGILFKPRSLL
ncbi:MAG: MFS transporter [bacterium]|nr:MFS transporter [bacterium]